MKRYFDFDMNDYKDRKCNFHSHTVRCQHAVGEEREYVEEAIKEGFEVIGFSDHSPYLFKNGYVYKNPHDKCPSWRTNCKNHWKTP
mgnify:CR=1 FL=1